jgi:4-carboxymuconolactone decarboxylase
MSGQEAQEYLDEMVRQRGYVLEYHKRLVAADHEFARAVNDIVEAAYLKPRLLDPKVKELIFIVSLTSMRATKAHIQSHIKVALELGCTPEEILEAIEISMPEAGVVAFQEGFNAWAEVVGAPALEPTVDTAGDRKDQNHGQGD